jgi:hypothetical protein
LRVNQDKGSASSINIPPLSATTPVTSGAALLVLAVAGGAAVYAVALSALWFAAGRPHGAEHLLARQVLHFARRRAARG